MSMSLLDVVAGLPDGHGIAIDANCPKCGYPERSLQRRIVDGQPVALFCCRKCDYTSTERDS